MTPVICKNERPLIAKSTAIYSFFINSDLMVGQHNACTRVHTICCASTRTRLNVHSQGLASLPLPGRSNTHVDFSTARLISSGSIRFASARQIRLSTLYKTTRILVKFSHWPDFVLRSYEQCLPCDNMQPPPSPQRTHEPMDPCLHACTAQSSKHCLRHCDGFEAQCLQ